MLIGIFTSPLSDAKPQTQYSLNAGKKKIKQEVRRKGEERQMFRMVINETTYRSIFCSGH